MASHAIETIAAAIRARAVRLLATTALALGGALPADAAVTVSHLNDLPFGTISNPLIDARQSESVCADPGVLGGRYGVTAIGSGGGGAFLLSAGAGATLPYEVQWAANASQTTGTQLSPGVQLTGQNAILLDCSLGAQNNASLIVILRADALGGATAGSYSGTLQIMLAPN